VPLTTADDESYADVVGVLADPFRLEAFAEDLVPVTGALTFRQAFSETLGLGARLGTTVNFYTGDEDYDTETLVEYGASATYAAGAARFNVGFAGRWNATADEGSFSDRSLHLASFAADMQLGGVRPGVTVRLPLDKEYRDMVGSTIGLYLQVPLR
jgi:hypothetical protein